MDGPQDVGSKPGFGPVEPTRDEPPFEHEWEARMFGIDRAMARPSDWNGHKFRFTRDQLPTVTYRTRPYFDQWYSSYAVMLLGSQLVTTTELATGHSSQPVTHLNKPMSAGDVEIARHRSSRHDREYDGQARFAVGDRVRASRIGNPGHTRLPQYVRGHVGVVLGCHGAHWMPDEGVKGRSVVEPLYTIAFELSELYPEQKGSPDIVHLDLWERYLEPIG